jgi:hypothetical protein
MDQVCERGAGASEKDVSLKSRVLDEYLWTGSLNSSISASCHTPQSWWLDVYWLVVCSNLM